MPRREGGKRTEKRNIIQGNFAGVSLGYGGGGGGLEKCAYVKRLKGDLGKGPSFSDRKEGGRES